MQLNTRLFGEIEIEEEKIIFFENGIIGFPDCTRFTLIFDLKEDGSALMAKVGRYLIGRIEALSAAQNPKQQEKG